MNTAIRLPEPLSVVTTEQGLEITLPIREELIFFPGHFPIRPVLPGVVIIDWVMELAQQHLGLKAKEPLQMEVIKFKQPVIASDETIVSLTLKHAVAKNKLIFSLCSDKGEHSSGRIVLEATEESQ